jgi:hypothetical protein
MRLRPRPPVPQDRRNDWHRGGKNKARRPSVASNPTCLGRGGVTRGMRPLRFGFQAVDLVNDQIRPPAFSTPSGHGRVSVRKTATESACATQEPTHSRS